MAIDKDIKVCLQLEENVTAFAAVEKIGKFPSFLWKTRVSLFLRRKFQGFLTPFTGGKNPEAGPPGAAGWGFILCGQF